jgi:hypothetical protein
MRIKEERRSDADVAEVTGCLRALRVHGGYRWVITTGGGLGLIATSRLEVLLPFSELGARQWPQSCGCSTRASMVGRLGLVVSAQIGPRMPAKKIYAHKVAAGIICADDASRG